MFWNETKENCDSIPREKFNIRIVHWKGFFVFAYKQGNHITDILGNV